MMPTCNCFPRKKSWAFITSSESSIPTQFLYNDETTLWMKTRRNGDTTISTKYFPLSLSERVKNKQILKIKRGHIATIITKIGDNCRVRVDSKTLNVQNAVTVHKRKVTINVDGMVIHLTHCKQPFEVYIPDEVFDKYDAVEEIAITTFVKLYKIKRKNDDTCDVIKVANKDPNGTAQRALEREIDILARLSHENIIKFVAAKLNPLYMIVEYASGGSLKDYIMKNGPLDEAEAKLVFKQILSALRYLHENMISHRDIKPDNIVLMEKNSLHHVKLIDFDVSSYIPPGGGMISGVGTYAFMSPTLMDNYVHHCDYIYTERTDIWSFGVALYFALTKKLPYNQGFDKWRYIWTERKGKLKTDCSRFNNLSLFAQNTITACLEYSEVDRPSARDLLDTYHWFTSNTD